jgi:hypothetical protein
MEPLWTARHKQLQKHGAYSQGKRLTASYKLLIMVKVWEKPSFFTVVFHV